MFGESVLTSANHVRRFLDVWRVRYDYCKVCWVFVSLWRSRFDFNKAGRRLLDIRRVRFDF